MERGSRTGEHCGDGAASERNRGAQAHEAQGAEWFADEEGWSLANALVLDRGGRRPLDRNQAVR